MQAWQHPWFEPAMLVGLKAGGFALENVLGSGGFGAVYLTHNAEGQALAIKVLFPPVSRESADMEDHTSRLGHFQREIQSAASLRHPNIMRILTSGVLLWHYDAPLENGRESYRSGDYHLNYYVTDYLPDSVENRLRDGLFTSADAMSIGRQICEGLEALHGADPGILHLDLNPSNIRLAERGRVVITDFGLVRIEGYPQGDLTRGEPVWIPPYVAAPEQRAGEPLDARTDIYQVGALLFLMLTGKTRREYAVLTLLDQPNVPQSLARVIERCTRNAPEMRFEDVTRFKEALVEAKASRFEKFVQIPARSLTDKVTKGDDWLGSHVPPIWRSPFAWLSAALFGLVFTYYVGGIFPASPVQISIASSSTKKEWLVEAVRNFNDASRSEKNFQLAGSPFRLKDRPIEVEIKLEQREPGVWDHYRSGSMINDILDQQVEPTIASPAERSWIERLSEEWTGASQIFSSKGEDLLQTPLVIAMWQSRAEALSCWPAAGPECTWDTLRSLARNPDGWGMFGHPEWGKLKYGYGFVGRSNSATFTEVLIRKSGLDRGLSIDQVRVDSPCGEAMADLEEADIHIYDRSDRALVEMRVRGPDFLDAATTYEQEVVELNKEFGPALPEPVVAAYPQDGTIVPTHPFAILDGAPWVTSDQAKAADIFLEYLLSQEQQSLLLGHGLRPINFAAPLEPPISAAFGADPQANLVIVDVPDTDVISAVVALWECVRLDNCQK